MMRTHIGQSTIPYFNGIKTTLSLPSHTSSPFNPLDASHLPTILTAMPTTPSTISTDITVD